jgi:hypothetical protein
MHESSPVLIIPLTLHDSAPDPQGVFRKPSGIAQRRYRNVNTDNAAAVGRNLHLAHRVVYDATYFSNFLKGFMRFRHS